MSNPQDLIDLVLALHDGTVDLEDLTDDETEMAIEGYRLLIDTLKDDPDQVEMVAALQAVLAAFDVEDAATDDFEDAIEAAEARGSTYWELENDTIH